MKYKALLLSLALTTVLASCGDDEDPITTTTNLNQTSQDHALLDAEFNAVFNTVDGVANQDTSIKSTQTVLPLCATRTFDAATKTLVIDYGTTNCLCGDGLNRRGKVTAVFNGKYRTQGTTVNVTLQDYFVNDIEFQGRKEIENLGNGTGNFKYSYAVLDAKAITDDGTITWQTQATIERVEGDSTLNPFDDVYEVTGTSNGINRKGSSFMVAIDENNPLVRKISLDPLCWRNFVAGILTINDDSGNNFELNYDPDNEQKCDREALLTINGGRSVTILMR